MDVPCKNCGFNNYEQVDGYYYCVECNEQLENLVDKEINLFDNDALFFDIRTGTKSNKKAVEKQKEIKQKALESKSTSFEEYNYILRGLVDEILMIEDIPNFKKTVLQLWITYLKHLEVAFFDNDNLAHLPKFYALYRPQDAQILYNKKPVSKRKRRVYKSKTTVKIESDTIEARKLRRKSSRKSLKKIQKMNEETENESFLSSNTSTLTNMTIEDIEASMLGQELNIEYSEAAKASRERFLNYAIPRNKKVNYDENGEAIIVSSPATKKNNILILSGRLLIVIIYCALNICGSTIQLSDLLRFIRNGNISYYNLKKYLPEKFEDVKLSLTKFHTFHHTTYHSMMNNLNDFFFHFPDTQMCLKPPNLAILVQRYIEDLNLPLCLVGYVEKLMELLPSKFTPKKIEYPKYESRAMAYILFVLKLLFGLDGYREKEISKSTKEINSQLKNLGSSQRLFDYEAWREYIEYREILLNKYYYPSIHNSEYKLDRPYENFVSMLDNVKPMTFRTYTSETKMNKIQRTHIHRKAVTKEIIQKLLNLHEESPTKSLRFECSFTPLKDALRVILESPLESTVNNSLLRDFSNDTLEYHFDPDSLVELFRQYGMEISTKKSTFPKNYSFQKGNCPIYNINNLCSRKTKISHDTIDAKKWKKNLIQQQKDNLKMKADNKVSYHIKAMSSVITKRATLRNLIKQKMALEGQSDGEEDLEYDEIVTDTFKNDDSSKITFVHPDFNLWFRYLSMSPFRIPAFREEVSKLPKSFLWLLNTASNIIHLGAEFIYFHEMLIENEFVNIYKPLELTDKLKIDQENTELPLHCHW